MNLKNNEWGKSSFATNLMILIIIILAGALIWSLRDDSVEVKFSVNDDTENQSVIDEPASKEEAIISFFSGEAEFSEDGENWQPAEEEAVVKEGYKIQTGDGKLILEFKDGSLFRMNEYTEVELSELSEDKTALIQNGGETYHRVFGENYEVYAWGQKITSLGTAFDIACQAEEDKVNVKVLKNEVEVESESEKRTVEEGEAADIHTKDKTISVSEIKKENLESGWIAWNADEDYKKSFSLGILPSPEEEEEEEDGPVDLKLGAETTEDGVELSWEPYSGENFEFYKIVRSEDNPELIYPDDGYIKYSGEQDFSSYLDITSKKDKEYYYRICAKVDKDEIECGNIIKIKAINESEIKKEEEVKEEKEEVKNNEKSAAYLPVTDALELTAEAGGGGVSLSWTPSVSEGFKYYKVVRSETNSDLYYPNDGYIKYIADKSQTSYFDNTAVAGKSYYYRVCNKEASGEVWCGNVVQINK